jgi:hypothetical protein
MSLTDPANPVAAHVGGTNRAMAKSIQPVRVPFSLGATRRHGRTQGSRIAGDDAPRVLPTGAPIVEARLPVRALATAATCGDTPSFTRPIIPLARRPPSSPGKTQPSADPQRQIEAARALRSAAPARGRD